MLTSGCWIVYNCPSPGGAAQISMPSRKVHAERSVALCGKPYLEVHEWLDALFPLWLSLEHRDERHNLEGVEEVRKEWGDEAAGVAILHICDDWNLLPGQLPRDQKEAILLRRNYHLYKQLRGQDVMKKCEGKILDDNFKEAPCPRLAITTRKDWRFGVGNEPKLVEIEINLCGSCADRWDDIQAEGEAEAAGS